jgi:hypothetical protein
VERPHHDGQTRQKQEIRGNSLLNKWQACGQVKETRALVGQDYVKGGGYNACGWVIHEVREVGFWHASRVGTRSRASCQGMANKRTLDQPIRPSGIVP